MKPTRKQIEALKKKIDAALSISALSYADISRISDVDQSQVSRICRGQFKTFSNNVVQVCSVLDVRVPRLLTEKVMDPGWKKAQASMRRIWDQTPDGANVITRLLEVIADLQESARREAVKRAPDDNSGS